MQLISTKKMASDSIFNSSSEKRRWVIEIRELLNRDDLQKAFESPASIFRLPDSVRNDKPEAYSPRRVALGPYHHFRQDLYKMELYKLEKAKKVREKLRLPEFPQLGNELKELDLRIGACFNEFLEMDGETLIWMMVVDGLFLLGLLVAISENREGGFGGLNFPLSKFDEEKFYPNLDRKILSQYEILSDVVMLENQIPCLVLERIFSSELNRSLAVLLYDFYVAVSPFLGKGVVPPFGYSDSIKILEQSHHLLHFMYLSILFIPKPPIRSSLDPSCLRDLEPSTRRHPPTPLSFFQISLNVLGFALNLPFIMLLKQAIDLILVLLELLKSVINPCFGQEVSPAIPSASELEKVKVKFQTSSNKILKASFDKDSTIVFLPSVSIDALSEVVLRNLVAFEAVAELNPPCLAQYLSLMSGLIVTTKDVKILKKKNIICSQLERDEEVVEFFNGIKNSTSGLKKTHRPKIHYVIKDSTNSVEENVFKSQSATATLLNRNKESTLRSEETSQPEMYNQKVMASKPANDKELAAYLDTTKEDDITLTSADYAKMNYQDEMVPKSPRQKTEIYEKIKEQDELVLVEENILRSQSATNEESATLLSKTKESALRLTEISQPEMYHREVMASKPANDEELAAYLKKMEDEAYLNKLKEKMKEEAFFKKKKEEAYLNRMKEEAYFKKMKEEAYFKKMKEEAYFKKMKEDEAYLNKMMEDDIILTSVGYANMNYQDEKTPVSRRRQEIEIYEKIKEDYEKGLKGMVEEIKKYYESCWRVKAKRLMKKYVSPVLMSVVILIIIFLVILVIVRLACSFVSCPKIIKTSAAANVISLADL